MKQIILILKPTNWANTFEAPNITMRQIFAVLVILLCLPIFILIAIAIKISNPGQAIFFKQARIGRDWETFDIFKFTTMNNSLPPANLPDSQLNRKVEESRITKFGRFLRKTKLDELPQLINVARGEMSFVGWRPVMPDHYYLKSAFAVGKTLPGITGWEQTSNKRDDLGYRHASYDRWYATRRCFLINMYIVFIRTPLYIIQKCLV